MIRPLLLWHPEHAGVLVYVERGWWGRLFKSRRFATLGEVLRFSRAVRGSQ